MQRPSPRLHASYVALAAALALAACEKPAQTPPPAAAAPPPPALPLTAGPETPPAPAPAVKRLPAAPPAKVTRLARPQDRYAYLDQAYAMNDSLADAPPDYGVDYGGDRPWVWRGRDDSMRVVEPVDGGYRYYYYRPGADYPYLVRDPQYAYGYSGDQLTVVYDAYGRPLPDDYAYRQAEDAGRYLARARALYQASLDNDRRSVAAANWAARRAEMAAERAAWAEQQSRDAEWRAYHAAHEAEEQAYWRDERMQREAAANRFAAWRQANYQGPPPPPAWAPPPPRPADNPARRLLPWAFGDRNRPPPPQAVAFDANRQAAQAAAERAQADRAQADRAQADQARRLADEQRAQQAQAAQQAQQQRLQQMQAQRQAEAAQRVQAEQQQARQMQAQRQAEQQQRAQQAQA
ncbi:hypothetical protein C5708_10055, partial [Caulobacter sp. CCUG 60055]|nr:hypothetical protein [Caulobacter sp. CCUG 60055]